MQINPTKMAVATEQGGLGFLAYGGSQALCTPWRAQASTHTRASAWVARGRGWPANHHRPLAQAAPCPKGTPTLIWVALQGKPAGTHPCTRPLSYLIKE